MYNSQADTMSNSCQMHLSLPPTYDVRFVRLTCFAYVHMMSAAQQCPHSITHNITTSTQRYVNWPHLCVYVRWYCHQMRALRSAEPANVYTQRLLSPLFFGHCRRQIMPEGISTSQETPARSLCRLTNDSHAHWSWNSKTCWCNYIYSTHAHWLPYSTYSM